MLESNGCLVQAENSVSRVLEIIVTVFFTVILCLTILMVILRYVFNSSINGGNELMEYLFIYTTSLGAAVSIAKGDHIRISFFVDLLPHLVKKIIRCLNYVLIAFINVVISYLSIFWITKVGGSESPVMRIPMKFIQISIPLGCLFVVLFCVGRIIRIINPGNQEVV